MDGEREREATSDGGRHVWFWVLVMGAALWGALVVRRDARTGGPGYGETVTFPEDEGVDELIETEGTIRKPGRLFSSRVRLTTTRRTW